MVLPSYPLCPNQAFFGELGCQESFIQSLSDGLVAPTQVGPPLSSLGIWAESIVRHSRKARVRVLSYMEGEYIKSSD